MAPSIEKHDQPSLNKVTVYYDGACPKCRRDRKTYERFSGNSANHVCWFDITDKDEQLRKQGIDPQKALTELHVQKPNGEIVSELDAYIVLLEQTRLLKPLAWLIGLPLIRPCLAKIYHWRVNLRLGKRGFRQT